METYIDAADIMVSFKKYRKSLSYDELFDIEIETSKLKLTEKGKERFKKHDKYSTYLAKRYDRHKKK